MNATLEGRKILLLSSNFGTETDEIRSPLATLRDAGARVTVAAPETGVVATLERDRDPGPEIPVDVAHDTVKAADFDALVLPGGTLNADALRTDETAQFLVRAFAADGKPVAAICHAPWLLVETGLADGRELTSVPTIRTDLTNAGGRWTDEEVVVDDSAGFRLITSRTPDDLDAFNAAIIDALR
ncbi:type 1 glutamine amidotransferase domain-containing protein [Brachybacterium sp.]|uniref:type 1 glutamine amidotransferase domain-containing protein n=1 Tax=Brachybacterium sp. TaxID=1891286 RepID=UPI002ED04BE1